MKWNTISRVVKNNKTSRYYKLLMHIQDGDYVYYASYYLYRPKRKKIIGNWMGLGWYTSVSHAMRGLRRTFKGNNLSIIKDGE